MLSNSGGLLASSRPFLSCTCLTGLLPAAATKQASGLHPEVPCLLSLPRLTSKLGSAFLLHGLHFRPIHSLDGLLVEDSSGTDSIAASLAAASFNAMMECSPSDLSTTLR